MMERITEESPRLKARMAGAFYVVAGLTSVIGGMYIPGKLVVAGDAATTANEILAHKHLFELGFSVMLMAVVCSIALTALFYDLFKPVNKTLSLTAAFVHLLGLAILGVASLLQLAPLVVLEGGHYMSVFKLEQVQALAYLFLQLNTQAGNAFLAFFGLYCILIGYLIFRSTFLPRIIGVFMVLAGLGYMNLPVAAARRLFVPLQSSPCCSRRRIADAVATRGWRERSTVEGAGQRSAVRERIEGVRQDAITQIGSSS